MKKTPQSRADRATHSTGPRSAEGKARSCMNALKSGIYSKSLVIPGENPAHLDALTDEYYQRYRPAHPEQRDLVDILVRSTLTLRRFAVAEAQVWTYRLDTSIKLSITPAMGHAFSACDRTLDRLQRFVNSTQRNYRNALHELERLQSLDLTAETPPSPGIPTPKPGPILVPDPVSTPQPVEPEPAGPSGEFVSSTPAPPPPAPPKAPKKAPDAAPKPLPFHKPGSDCYFDSLDRSPYSRCPLCFPDDGGPE